MTGKGRRRSTRITRLLRRVADLRRRRQIGAHIVEGYRRRPQTATDDGWADDATVRTITDEPWVETLRGRYRGRGPSTDRARQQARAEDADAEARR